MNYNWNWGIFWEMSADGRHTWAMTLVIGLGWTLLTAACAGVNTTTRFTKIPAASGKAWNPVNWWSGCSRTASRHGWDSSYTRSCGIRRYAACETAGGGSKR